MTMPSILQLLQNTFSPDQNLLKEASQKLDAFANENFGNYLGVLCQEMVNDQNPSDVRYAAALAVKNTLTAKDQQRKEELIKRWFQTEVNVRVQVKAMCLQTLRAVDLKSAMSAAQVCSAIAEIELPRNEWPDLMTTLMQSVSSDSVNLKMASLKTIGFICESIDQEVLSTQANAILTAVAQGARKEETDDVRFVAIQALYNSLEFISVNFENEMERNYIMQVVCEGTQCQSENVVVASYQCLVRIMSLYYAFMPVYMQQALYNLTIMGMKHDNQNIALQAVEFWSTVCEVELDIEDENEFATTEGTPLKQDFHFANGALKEITPVLLWLLTKKEDDEDEDEWNVSMAAATCIQLLANVCRDEIVGHVIQFVEGHIKHSDWRFRDAAVMAFGSIMEGPSEKVLGPLSQSALKILCEMITDPVIAVKDTVSWTLGRLCEKLCDSISSSDMAYVVQALVYGLSDSPRVGANCAWAIMNLSDNFGNDMDPDAQSYMLSPYFEALVTALMNAGEKSGADNNYRASVYEAVASLVSNAPTDCLPTVSKISSVVLDLLNKSVSMQAQLVGADERRIHIELQANLCSVLTSIIRRVKGEIAPLSDGIMQLLLTIMSNAARTSTLLEDAFLTIGALTTAMEGQFVRYIDSFLPFLMNALQNHEEHAMCSIAVGTIGDISRAVNDALIPYCDTLMTALLENIQSPILYRDVKPVIISCFGDIALAIGGAFEKYLAVVFQILNSAFQSTTQDIEGDYELEDYFLMLRESILEASVGITQGLKGSGKAYLLNDYLVGIFAMQQECFRDGDRSESISSTMVGLLGDLAESYPPGQLKTFYSAPWIDALIKEVRSNRHGSSASKEIAKWAREIIKTQQ